MYSNCMLSHVVLILKLIWADFELQVIYLHLLPDWVFSNADAAMEWMLKNV